MHTENIGNKTWKKAYRESILKNATKKSIFSQNTSFKVRLQEKE
jgi:hypothetical protein